MLLGMIVVSGCTDISPPGTENEPSPVPTATAPAVGSQRDQFQGLPVLQGEATVQMKVNGGTITLKIDGTKAPLTAGNFVDLVERGFYNGLKFHRVVREPEPFVVQGGDPLGNGTGGFVDPATGGERRIPLEITPAGESVPVYSQTFPMAGIKKLPALQHTRGAVAMARSQFPDSASSQFYFTLADLSFLDGNYAVFGYVTSGMDVVDRIEQGNTIESATVIAGLENLKR